MSDFGATIAALADHGAERNISSIKSAVGMRLRESDETVSVEATDFFNHSFAPDLVLHWADRESRRVYLRTTTNPGYLLEDLAAVGASEPILMSLGSVRLETENIGQLQQAAAGSRTLVTEPEGLGALVAEKIESPVVGLLSRAVLQGGRGLMPEQRARSAGEALAGGFEGARRAEVEATAAAVEAAEGLLSGEQAGRLTRLLHAVWIGSGAPASAFPRGSGTTATLDASSLQFLLDAGDLDDDEFWLRLAHGLTLQRLSEVSVATGVAERNLQRLLKHAVHRLQAKSVRVLAVDDAPARVGKADVEDAELAWFVRDGFLGLAATTWQAFFSARSLSDASALPETDNPTVGLRDLLGRARAGGVRLLELELETRSGRQISYGAGDGAEDIADDKLLTQLQSVIGEGSSVRAAVASVGGGQRQLRCNLVRRNATGRTAARFYLTEVVDTALPLLVPLSPAQRRALVALTSDVEPAGAPETGSAEPST